jgi:tetratricopeptide (TPR) repeat protein
VYDLDPYDLNSLALQLQMAKEVELAIEVLGLTTDVYPQHVHSYVQLGRLYLLKGENALARETLLKALSIEPTDATAAGLLKRLH